MKKRLITSIYIVLGLGLALVSRIWTLYIFDLLMLGLAVMGAVEVARALERQGKYTNFVIVSTMPAVLYLAFVIIFRLGIDWKYMLLIILCAFVLYFLITFIFYLCAKKTVAKEMEKYGLVDVKTTRYALDKAMYSLSVMVYPTLLFMSLIFINHLYQFSFSGYSQELAPDFKKLTWFVLLSVFVLTTVTDTMAYLVGSKVKGPKLCPLISPNKTISGAVGGLVGGVAATMGLYLVFTTSTIFKWEMIAIKCSWWMILLISLVGSIISQLGDILASALKRKSRVKDFGTIFPGHGGVMDRVDGLVCNAMFTFLVYFIMFILA